MHHTQIIKGLLDILNSNHEKMKLTNEQISVKNEAHKLLNGQEGFYITGKRAFDGDIGVDGIEDIKAEVRRYLGFAPSDVKSTTDWRAALQSDRDLKNKIAKSIEPVDIGIINKITPSNCRGLK